MILTPADTELTWAHVEADAKEIPWMAEAIWKSCGIVMPDDAAEAMMLDHLDTLLTSTAAALALPLQEVFPSRQRIRWFQFTDTPGRYSIFAKVDDGPPCKLHGLDGAHALVTFSTQTRGLE